MSKLLQFRELCSGAGLAGTERQVKTGVRPKARTTGEK